MNSSKKNVDQTKQESTNNGQFSRTPSSSRQQSWTSFNNPRIVRVSRSFGGKDRHSKVFTIRGLRDRRIRLSVNSAIQLYNLQDKLGLGQPSKVVDWLLNATKHEIYKLPPLQIPPKSFNHFHQLDDQYFDSSLREISKEITTTNEQENQESNQSSFLGMLNNPIPFNSYYYSEPNTFSIGTQDSQNNVSGNITMPFSSGSPLYFHPTATTLTLPARSLDMISNTSYDQAKGFRSREDTDHYSCNY